MMFRFDLDLGRVRLVRGALKFVLLAVTFFIVDVLLDLHWRLSGMM